MAASADDSRLNALRSAPPESWIALSEDESTLIAVGSTYEEAVAKSEKAGVSDPILIKTPNTWAPFSM